MDRFDFEIHSDSTEVTLSVRIVDEAKQQARLADTWVADQQYLEQIVILNFKIDCRIILHDYKSEPKANSSREMKDIR